MTLVMLSTLVACGEPNDSTDTNNSNVSASNFEVEYPGYYVKSEDGIISVTNYDQDNMGNIPLYQELIEYGKGAGLETDDTVYYIYVFDAENSNEDNEKYYYAELADETMEILIEEDSYFADEEERKKVVDKLIEIMDYVRNDSNE